VGEIKADGGHQLALRRELDTQKSNGGECDPCVGHIKQKLATVVAAECPWAVEYVKLI